MHPPNARKGNTPQWLAVLDRIEHGMVPSVQKGQVEWTGGLADWMGPERREPFVFVVSGRNVAPGRLRRCIESMARQKGPRWGAVLFDDASEPRIAEYFEIACASLGARCTVVRNRRRRGLLANMVTAVRMICTDPETVVVTLDADDALIGDRVLERLAAEYERGADVTVGSMLRTDKVADYPVCFDRPREQRGGNVWQHLRSFRKRLFDAVPDEALRLDGDYVDIATDWAFMLPIVEMAAHPVHVVEQLYLYEPSGYRKGFERERREATIGRIIAKPPVFSTVGTDATEHMREHGSAFLGGVQTGGDEVMTGMSATSAYDLDLRDVRGQIGARRALEIAAGGGHNLLMMGPARVRQDDAGEAPAGPGAGGARGRTLLASNTALHRVGDEHVRGQRTCAAGRRVDAEPAAPSRPFGRV